VLLVDLGTPASPSPRDVRRYLREFLGDPRVLTMPGPVRKLLLEGVILPFRPRRSAHAYAQIWTDAGSPLLVNDRALAVRLAEALETGFCIELGMRYGEPSIAGAVDALRTRASDAPLIVVPLFPQFADSTVGSASERIGSIAGACDPPIATQILPVFFDDAGYIDAVAAVARPALEAFGPDHVLMSYHGLPESHVRKSDPGCLASQDCCERSTAPGTGCYRAQCFATSRALRTALALSEDRCSTAFQSRLGPTRWIRPETTARLEALRESGTRRLAVMCPSFASDCLETLEEIGIRARERWLELGGEAFALVPCVNASPGWVQALAKRVREAA